MAPTLDQIVEQAYKLIDDQTDYKIPKLESWKKAQKIIGNGLSACQACGAPIPHAKDKHPMRCPACRKKVSELFRARKNKHFCKNSVITT